MFPPAFLLNVDNSPPSCRDRLAIEAPAGNCPLGPREAEMGIANTIRLSDDWRALLGHLAMTAIAGYDAILEFIAAIERALLVMVVVEMAGKELGRA